MKDALRREQGTFLVSWDLNDRGINYTMNLKARTINLTVYLLLLHARDFRVQTLESLHVISLRQAILFTLCCGHVAVSFLFFLSVCQLLHIEQRTYLVLEFPNSLVLHLLSLG